MRQGPLRAAIVEGALALAHGWDPLRYLDLPHEDRVVATAILEEARDRRLEHDHQHWKNLQAAVQNGVARAFGG